MDISTWQSILDVDDVQEIKDATVKAEALGHEAFGEVILTLTDDVIRSEAFSALVSALIVGNLAFNAAPMMQIELSDDVTLSVRLDQP